MRSKNWIVALAALVLCAGTVHAAPPLEAYGRLPTLSDMTLSPDGKTIAFVKGNESDRLIIVETIGVSKPLSVLDIHDKKLRSLQWADNTHLLIVTSMTKLPVGLIGSRSECFLGQYLDIKDGSLHPLLRQMDNAPHDVQAMNVIFGTPEPRTIDGHTVVFVRGEYFSGSGAGHGGLFRQDLTTGATALASREEATHAEDWLVDARGGIVAEADYYENGQRWTLNLDPNGNYSKAMDVSAPIERPGIEGLSSDGAAIVVQLPETDDLPQYERISIKDGSSQPWSGAHYKDLIKDGRTGRVIGAPLSVDKNDYVFFDPHADMVWRSVKAAFAGATDVDLVSWSDDRSKVVVKVFGPSYGAGYFFVDMTTHKASPVGNLYDRIDAISTESWIAYTAADGRVIHAYLTLPMGRPAQGLPLIVLPHGGPHARDEPGFDWLSQGIASRGYAVLQPEFRGSYGFGKDLLWAGFGEFGKKMQTDLSDGVRALAAKGVIDPKRVCIVGASYGGYAALAGATLDTGVYRCAVSDAGISDLHKLVASMDNSFDDEGERFWDRFLGVKDADDPKLDAISPIKHIDKVSIPILLIHGRDDTRVPFAQSQDMADALKAAGKPVEFVTLESEDHFLSRSATRLQMLEATVKFLEANNPPN